MWRPSDRHFGLPADPVRPVSPKRPPATADPPRFFAAAAELRAWYEANHASHDVLWVGLYKKGTGLQTLTIADSIDQALCFGWIDGMKRTIDEKSYKVRFTPRRRRSSWSARNVARMEALIAAGQVTDAGLKAYPGAPALTELKDRDPGISRCGRPSLRTG